MASGMGRHGALHCISLDCMAFRLIHWIALHCIRHYISLLCRRATSDGGGVNDLLRRCRTVLIGRLARAAGLAESDSGGGKPGHCASDISDI